MIHVLHGDDTIASRKYIKTLVGEKQSTFLDGRTVSYAVLEEHLSSTGLFGDEKAIILDNFLSKNKKKKEILKQLSQLNLTTTIIMWEATKLTKPQLDLIKGEDIKAFQLPDYYFQFLDSFMPGDPQRVYALYHNLLQTMTTERIFYSIIIRMRQLVILQLGDIKGSKDTAYLQAWQVDKLKRQLSRWSNDVLMDTFKQLHETEINIKSGGMPIDLSKYLDILILTRLR